MSGPAAAHRGTNVEEFLGFEGELDTRYELVEGEIVAMAPPHAVHGTIVSNAALECGSRLRQRPPGRTVSEGGIYLDDYNFYVADLVATCEEPSEDVFVHEPALIVEVLSESTHRDDIAVKVKRYIELPAVQEIWLVDSRARWVQVWLRTGDSWTLSMPLRGQASFESRFLRDRIELDQLYRNSGLSDEPEAQASASAPR